MEYAFLKNQKGACKSSWGLQAPFKQKRKKKGCYLTCTALRFHGEC